MEDCATLEVPSIQLSQEEEALQIWEGAHAIAKASAKPTYILEIIDYYTGSYVLTKIVNESVKHCCKLFICNLQSWSLGI